MIEFQLLGTLALVRRDGQEARPLLVRPKQIALLAYLTIRQPRGWQQRNSLLSLFWPESDDRRARFSLRSALHGLRSELGADAILARGDDELAVNFDLVRCDALAFEDALDAKRLEDALDLYRGPLLEGLVVTGLADFHIWSDERREGLRRRAVGAAVALADQAESRHDVDAELRWARRALELSPHEEALLRRELGVLDQRGERAEALRVYEQWATRMRAEMESEPSPETVSFVERLRESSAPIRTGHTALSAAPTPIADASSRYVPVPTTPSTPQSQSRGIRARTATIGLVALGALAIVLSFTARRLAHNETTHVASPGSGTAVLPFTFAGAPKFAPLADAVVALLSAGLGDAGPLRSVDPQIVATFVSTQPPGTPPLALGAAAGRRLGVSQFIVGSIVEERGVLRMQASLYAVGNDSAPLGRASASGSADSIFTIADRLATDLLAARMGTASANALGTSSLPALQAYVDGERQLFAARYSAAADAYARAVAADSGFARAYFRLSYAASLSGHDGLARTAGARAKTLEARLSPGDHILLDAWFNSLHARIPESISLYENALGEDARNPEAWLQLAEVRYHWGPMLGISAASAADAFRHVIAEVPDNGAALIHLARIDARDAAHGGGFDTLAAAARKLNLTATEELELRMLSALLSGRTSERDSVLAEAAARGAVTEKQLLAVALPFPDTTIAAALARDLSRAGINVALRVTGQVELAQIAAAHGHVRAALQIADSLATLAPDRAAEVRAWILTLPFVKATPAELLSARDVLSRTHDSKTSIGPSAVDIGAPTIYEPRRRYLDAVLSLLAGDSVRALSLAHDLDHMLLPNPHDSAFAADYAQSIRAELRMRAAPAHGAEAFLPPHTQPDKTYPDIMSFFAARDRYLRAEALAQAGHVREAIAWFETFPDPAGNDVWLLAPSLFRRAQLYQSLGRASDARLAYQRFVALWRNADADLMPMVQRALASP